MSDPSVIPTGPDLTAGLSIDSLEEGVPLLGHVEGMPVMLVRRGSDVFAIGATCTHYGGPLAEGLVVGQTVRCPWHHACFDLCTGRALRAPALNAVATYEVVRRQDSVVVLGPRETRAAAPARPPRADVPSSVAIIGAGAAGNSAAEELRHLGFEGTITLFDADGLRPMTDPICRRTTWPEPLGRNGCRCTPVRITKSWRWNSPSGVESSSSTRRPSSSRSMTGPPDGSARSSWRPVPTLYD